MPLSWFPHPLQALRLHGLQRTKATPAKDGILTCTWAKLMQQCVGRWDFRAQLELIIFFFFLLLPRQPQAKPWYLTCRLSACSFSALTSQRQRCQKHWPVNTSKKPSRASKTPQPHSSLVIHTKAADKKKKKKILGKLYNNYAGSFQAIYLQTDVWQ